MKEGGEIDAHFKLDNIDRVGDLLNTFHDGFGEVPHRNASSNVSEQTIPLSEPLKRRLVDALKEDYLLYESAS